MMQRSDLPDTNSAEAVQRPAFVVPAQTPTVTWALIAVNALVFGAMVLRGVSLTSPGSGDMLLWGADYAPLTVGEGQWWRILTSMFLHFGIVHIA